LREILVAAGTVVGDIGSLRKWCNIHKARPFRCRGRSETQKE
jgi:hypothetical protein